MKLHLGDCLEVLKEYPDNYFDSIVSDPPAGIAFMGKKWDDDKGGRDKWIAWMQTIAAEALRTLKPGAHALVWSLPRTSHWTATAWENGGWEVRDRISYLFGSGFPKSLDVSKAIDKMAGAEREVIGTKLGRPGMAKDGSNQRNGFDSAFGGKSSGIMPTDITAPATDAAKQFAGFGTALKPAIEDWWLLRKPISESSIAANVLKWGCGGLNIDACRVESGEDYQNAGFGPRYGETSMPNMGSHQTRPWVQNAINEGLPVKDSKPHANGRWPAQLIHDGSDCVLAEFAKCGESKSTSQPRHNSARINIAKGREYANVTNGHADSGTPARFFYCAKPSKSERNADGENNHPTLKSLALMRYLITLITPPGGIVLDPFAGSGTTIRAALELGFDAVGIEQDAEHFATMKRRADGATLPLFAEVA